MPNNNGDFRTRLSQAAFAFRGYNITNLGRTPELLAHPAYGRVVEWCRSDAILRIESVYRNSIQADKRVNKIICIIRTPNESGTNDPVVS